MLKLRIPSWFMNSIHSTCINYLKAHRNVEKPVQKEKRSWADDFPFHSSSLHFEFKSSVKCILFFSLCYAMHWRISSLPHQNHRLWTIAVASFAHANALNSNNIFAQLKFISPPHSTAYTIHIHLYSAIWMNLGRLIHLVHTILSVDWKPYERWSSYRTES